MSLSRVTTWSSGQVLTASALNGEIDNILNNALSLISPLTGNLDFGGFRTDNVSKGSLTTPGINFTGDTNSGLTSSAADVMELAAGGNEVLQLTGGTSDITYVDVDSGATGVAPIIRAEGETNTGLSLVSSGTKGITLNGGAFGGAIWGLTLSNNGSDATNDIDIAVGEAISSDAASADKVMMALTSAITKQLDAAWAVGTNAGGLDTGSIANTTYHVWLIKRTDTGVVDVLFSTSATAPTMPTNYDKKRRIGSILRESAAIVAFVQDGDLFQRKSPILDVNFVTNPGTNAVSRTVSVPIGIQVEAFGEVVFNRSTSDSALYLSDLDLNDDAASVTVAPLGNVLYTTVLAAAGKLTVPWRIRTSTSAQIRSRVNSSDANTTIAITTRGWYDTRGRDH